MVFNSGFVHCKCFSRNLSGLYSCPCISCTPIVLFAISSCTQQLFVTFTTEIVIKIATHKGVMIMIFTCSNYHCVPQRFYNFQLQIFRFQAGNSKLHKKYCFFQLSSFSDLLQNSATSQCMFCTRFMKLNVNQIHINGTQWDSNP